jgi:uncharacterized membrane protein YozB (DUF420 family)
MALRDTLGTVLPVVNACLNATCAALLLFGRGRIRRGERLPHARLMVAAFVTSAVFLASYLTRVWATGTTYFVGAAWLKYSYYAVLFSHMILAMVVLPLILRTLYLALQKRFAEHRRLARWTYPVWLYVSVTGVLVYVMLYHLADARVRAL